MTQLSDNNLVLIETEEEKQEFERIERDQQINAIAAVVRTCPTNSSTGIADCLFNAGCRVELFNVQI
ncbi:hypothetical protein ABIS04_16360 [Shewanella sp. H8]|uniref:hypothetical protein n=1 Tax=Shewanella sp. H8 TaxID=3342676 RepID=UPI0033161460